MIKHEKDNACVGCISMGLQCYGNACPNAERDVYWRECDMCGESDEKIYNVNGKELCAECAFNELITFNSKDRAERENAFNTMLKYIESDKWTQVDFYLNYLCESRIYADREKISDKVIDIVRNECLEFKEMVYEEMYEFCADDKDDFLEKLGYEECGDIDVDYDEEW